MTPKSRADAARNFPTHTCAASRHAQMIGEEMIHDEWYDPDGKEAIEAGESILSTVASLWEARARIAQLEADRDIWSAKLAAEVDAAVAECERLRAGYAEAIDDLADWGIYASDYFQTKHDLAGTIAKHRAAVDAAREAGKENDK